jgi:hypothetical protein
MATTSHLKLLRTVKDESKSLKEWHRQTEQHCAPSNGKASKSIHALLPNNSARAKYIRHMDARIRSYENNETKLRQGTELAGSHKDKACENDAKLETIQFRSNIRDLILKVGLVRTPKA